MQYVSVDLETTGLDIETDEIIEVAAIRFDASGVIDRYQSFVNPDRPLDYRIFRLTGIDERDLRAAPHFGSIALEIEEFVGLDPIVGQNPTFDTTFLARKGVQLFGPTFDTFELAGLLLPGLRQHSLAAIAEHLGVDFPVRHRAMPDAEAAMRVFLALRERLAASPPDLLAEAERLSALSDWTMRHLIRDIAQDHPRRPGDGEREGIVHGFVKAPSPPPEIGPPAKTNVGVPGEESVRVITSPVARESLVEYEERREQTVMARAVGEAIREGEQLIVEAGTGVGKSLAYLVPSLLHAARNNARTVVSTNTINLQEQLTGQDIPIARRLLTAAGVDPESLHMAQLKGRANYLCLLRWSSMLRVGSLDADEARVLVQLLFWLGHTDSGDRAELNLRREEEHVWRRVSAADGGCLQMQCAYVRDGSCFLLRARRRAEASHLLVVNHALLLSDLATGGNVLPEYRHLVVDEAHHLEEEATRQFGFSASEANLLDWLEALFTRVGRDREGGLVSTLYTTARASHGAISVAPQLQNIARTLSQTVTRARDAVPAFWRAIQEFGINHAANRNDYDERIGLTRGIRVQPDWADIEASWFATEERLAAVCGVLDEILVMLENANPSDLHDRDAVIAETADLLEDGQRLRSGLTRIINKDERDTVCWLTLGRRDDSPALSSAPLSVAETLRAALFEPKDSVVLTSATLSTEDHFEYMKGRLGLEHARELLLGSPFDYKTSTLILAPSDMPEPDQHGYLAATQTALIEMVRATEGRALALFTSHSGLRAAYGGIKKQLEEHGILVLGQGLDGSPRQLLAALRENERTFVLGAASFWEGVDVVGEALSLLVIARLPFAVPSDPVYQARSELFDHPFEQYALPQAILRFKQGFGRLIRRKTDRGVMVCLDRRLRSRQYGDAILRSLPACEIRDVPLRDLPAEVTGWLARPDVRAVP
jgi:DNA polymerase-3 subunit epsilon/ATP-dependent DNA helicase DinG